MSRRKSIDPKILEASKHFDVHLFADTIRGDFSDFPDYRRNQKRILYPVWQLALVILCGFFCGCNTIEEIVEYTLLQEEWFASLLGQPFRSPSYGAIWWFLVKTSPEALKGDLRKWFSKIPGSLRDQLLAIDGKRRCPTFISQDGGKGSRSSGNSGGASCGRYRLVARHLQMEKTGVLD